MSDPGHCPVSKPLPDLGPAEYARWHASDLGTITEALQLRLLFRLMGDCRGKSVLDVGCGDGTIAVELASRGARVTAIDASAEMLEMARRRAAEAGHAIDFHLASVQAMPFPAVSFDIVFAKTILCFVQDARPAFAEISRVLRPGGRLVIGELNKWSSWAAGRRIRAWAGSPLWKLGRFRTPRELQKLASGAGLVPGTVIGANYYPRWTRAARLVAPHEARIARVTTFGAAFLGMAADKPTT